MEVPITFCLVGNLLSFKPKPLTCSTEKELLNKKISDFFKDNENALDENAVFYLEHLDEAFYASTAMKRVYEMYALHEEPEQSTAIHSEVIADVDDGVTRSDALESDASRPTFADTQKKSSKLEIMLVYKIEKWEEIRRGRDKNRYVPINTTIA
ncbi:hypothetical protein COEREDRAFT_86804 [Coemansia reversa NRRL 1564]|uniref:Uncharacterized protein n=1 Tax=Coemansia reversa (strain ATCC 12441 / NRRL 1564) TaxID=763665 RepID=A0A2G5BCI8_COERN|nr:hypothetical protein COEREDRAFT_86804 [Coemansia reversa NRRL 1564]|eukprot:PIA16725.1 hypothetical protein COEREDRAFT_86804 [Coemansia reversa NRRL 1564]